MSCPARKDKKDYKPEVDHTIIKTILNLIQEQDRSKNKITKDIIIKYNDIIEARTLVLDWLIMVCHKLKQSDHTYFLAVEIIDKIIELYEFKLTGDDLHLTGIVSLFISSKNNEIQPIPIDILVKNVGQGKFSKYSILNAELQILKKLKFKLPQNQFIDYSFVILYNLYSSLSENNKLYLLTFSISMYKFATLDYNFYSSMSVMTRYSSVLYYSLIKLVHPKFLKKEQNLMWANILEEFNIKRKEVIKYCTILKNIKDDFNNKKLDYPYIRQVEFDKYE